MKKINVITRKYIATVVVGPLALIPALMAISLVARLFNAETASVVSDFKHGVMGLMIAYPATLIIGLPSILLLRKLNKFSLVALLFVSLIPVTIWFSIINAPIVAWLFFGYASISVAAGCWATFKWA